MAEFPTEVAVSHRLWTCNPTQGLLFSESCNRVTKALPVCRLQTRVVCATLGKLQTSSRASRWPIGLPR